MNPIYPIQQFQINGKIETIIPFGNGHINQTFRLINTDPTKPDYLLQRINHHIFTNVSALMDNIEKVTMHINRKSLGATLQLIKTKQNKNFHQDPNEFYWRLFIFRKTLRSYDVAETTKQIYEGAKAYGRFLYQLSDFPASTLYNTLPNFHNVFTRLTALKNAIKQNAYQRKRYAQSEISYTFSILNQMTLIQKMGDAQQFPLRVTHNDTKFNNVLLNTLGKGVCVIDLETVMPGFVHFDFGDGIRTTVTTAAEDEADLSNIQIDLERFRAFSTGYLEATQNTLTLKEIKYLPLSGALLAYLMGIRFLTDFLEGDRYYKTYFKEHNLQRAKTQFTLTKRLLERLPDLEKII